MTVFFIRLCERSEAISWHSRGVQEIATPLSRFAMTVFFIRLCERSEAIF
jgi:hypothetical protein